MSPRNSYPVLIPNLWYYLLTVIIIMSPCVPWRILWFCQFVISNLLQCVCSSQHCFSFCGYVGIMAINKNLYCYLTFIIHVTVFAHPNLLLPHFCADSISADKLCLLYYLPLEAEGSLLFNSYYFLWKLLFLVSTVCICVYINYCRPWLPLSDKLALRPQSLEQRSMTRSW